MSNLVGKFFIEDEDDHEWYRTGEVRHDVERGYLIRYDVSDGGANAPIQPMVIVTHEEITSMLDCGHKRWSFFDSRQELNRYIKWIETPAEAKPEAKVVKLTKH